VGAPEATSRPPPPKAKLLATVSLRKVSVPEVTKPAPAKATLPVKVLLVTRAEPVGSCARPPPQPPLTAVLEIKLELLTARLHRLRMAPPLPWSAVLDTKRLFCTLRVASSALCTAPPSGELLSWKSLSAMVPAPKFSTAPPRPLVAVFE